MNTFLGIICFFLVAWILWRLFSRRYSLPCPSWLSSLVEMDNPFVKTAQAATILQHLDLQPGMVIVDVGCGPGRLSIPAARKVGLTGKVVAMDVQAGMLQKCQEKARAENLTNIEFFHAGIGDKKLEHDKFDRVLLVTVLGEIPNREAALQEIFDALKPGGILSVTETIFDPHFQRCNTVLRLATMAGFRKKGHFGNWATFTLNLEKP
jgi:ubiquinone/menaquinone biosynthesis C-methylase UbiE